MLSEAHNVICTSSKHKQTVQLLYIRTVYEKRSLLSQILAAYFLPGIIQKLCAGFFLKMVDVGRPVFVLSVDCAINSTMDPTLSLSLYNILHISMLLPLSKTTTSNTS